MHGPPSRRRPQVPGPVRRCRTTRPRSADYSPCRCSRPSCASSAAYEGATSASVAGLASLAYASDAAAFLTEAYVHPGPRMPPPETGRDDLARRAWSTRSWRSSSRRRPRGGARRCCGGGKRAARAKRE